MVTAKTSELIQQVEKGDTIGVSLHYHNRYTIKFVNSLISKILAKNNLIFLQTTLFTILREIIVNAVKANTKRLYFDIENLDINNPDHYKNAIDDFKPFMLKNNELIEKELKKSKYRVWVYIKKFDNGFKFVVKNNTPMNSTEVNRVNFRMKKAKAYNDFTEVYGDVMDDSEGEGLGIILTMLFLRNSGIGEESLKIISDNENTKAILDVPFRLKPVEITNTIQNRIVEEVNELPSFPEHILRLQQMCRQPDVTMKSLSDEIRLDPSLTSSILRLSNSAGFITRNRIEDVNEAIKIIGLKNLYSILIAASSRKIMDDRYSSFRQIWNHCNKVAFYGRNIALKYRRAKLSDYVYLAGLLHDLGKIVLLSTNTKLTEWISDVTVGKKIRTSTIIEEISIGISHARIGEIIARKWNFPDYLIESIAHHHSPVNAADKYREIIDVTYLANEMCSIEEKKSEFDYIDNDVLEKYRLSDEEKFKLLHEELKKLHAKQDELIAV